MKATRGVCLHLIVLVGTAACAAGSSRGTDTDALSDATVDRLASELAGCYQLRFDRLFSSDPRLGPRGAYRLPDLVELTSGRASTTGTSIVGRRPPLLVRPVLSRALHYTSMWYPTQSGAEVVWDLGGIHRLALRLEAETDDSLLGTARWEQAGAPFDSTEVRLDRVVCSEAVRPPYRRVTQEPEIVWLTRFSPVGTQYDPSVRRLRSLSSAALRERDDSLHGFGLVAVAALPDRTEEVVVGWGVRWAGREEVGVEEALAIAFLTDANREQILRVLDFAPFSTLPENESEGPDISVVGVEADRVRLLVEGTEWVVAIPD